MFKQTSTSLILLGILAVIIGIIALAWPGVTVHALVLVFAVYAFLAAVLQTPRAFSSRTAGPVFGHLLLALISLAAGVVAVAWPAPTALVLVLVIGFWAIAGGIVEFADGFRRGEAAGTRAMYLLTGVVSVAFGVLLFLRPGVGAVTLALLFGLFSLIYGIAEITLGIQLHQLHQQRRSGRSPSAVRTAASGAGPDPWALVPACWRRRLPLLQRVPGQQADRLRAVSNSEMASYHHSWPGMRCCRGHSPLGYPYPARHGLA